MKVAHCISELEIGGAELSLYKTLTHTDLARYPATVISTTANGPVGEWLAREGIEVIALGKKRAIPSPRAVLQLVGTLQRAHVDLVQTHMYEANLYGLAAGRLLGLPIVWGIRCSDMDFSRYGWLSGLGFQLNRWLSSWPDAIIVNSESGRLYHLAKGFSGRRMTVISNGFDLDQYRPDPSARARLRAMLQVPENALLIGRFARFDPMKDYRTLIRAAVRVQKRHPEAFFLFVGAGVTSENLVIADQIREGGLGNRIFLLGQRQDVPWIMGGLDLCVSSSAFGEGFPNVIGEAMACGIPCVVTDVGDSARIVGDTGRVVPPKDEFELSRGIMEILDLPPERRSELGQAARRRVASQFDLSKVVDQTIQVYENIVSQRKVE